MVGTLKKRFRQIERDLDAMWPKIAQDYTGACSAERMTRFDGNLYKYRCKSTDMQKGARDGFRVICYRYPDTNTLYPIFVWPKLDYPLAPDNEVSDSIAELLEILTAPPPESP